ncbi:MAG: ABC transporter permease, partial [Oscillospiraceae bacterium]
MEMLQKFLIAAVLAGTPLLFGTVGEILSERVGHLNLGVEGMMSIGACAGFMVGYVTDSFTLAILAAFAAGALSGLLYAVLTVTFFANQNVTGLTLTIFGVGLSNFIGVYMLGRAANKTLKLPETITASMRSIHLAGLSDLPVVG